MEIERHEADAEDLAANAIVGIVTAAVAAISPELGVPAGGAAPYLARGLGAVFRRSIERQSQVVEQAADWMNVDPVDLLERLLNDARGEQLFRAAVTAARDSSSQEKLEAIARSLASGAASSDDAEVDLEILFLVAAAELEVLHVRVLQAFTRSSNELGLGIPAVEDFDVPVTDLNRAQILMSMSQLAASVDPVLATLVRLGLITQIETGGIRPGGPGPAWQITDFGRELLSRLEAMA